MMKNTVTTTAHIECSKTNVTTSYKQFTVFGFVTKLLGKETISVCKKYRGA